MNKSRLVLISIGSFILLAAAGLSYYARSVNPGDWIWTVRTEIRAHSKIDWYDIEMFYPGDDAWSFYIIHPFMDIDSPSDIESINIYTVHPVNFGNIHTPDVWRESHCSIDEYFRTNCDYMTRITGWKPKSYVLFLLATAPVYDKPYDKNYDEQNVCGTVIDFNLERGEQKTYIMVYDEQNVFYEKGTEGESRIYRKMPELLLEKLTLSYSETRKEYRKKKK